jgi:uncharacterized protein (TIGR02246 family)
MTQNSSETIKSLITAINHGDLEGALNMYEHGAKIVSGSGQLFTGKDAIRGILEGFIEKKPTIVMETEKRVNDKDIAIHCFKWTFDFNANGTQINGVGASSEVLRKQKDGSWRISFESPRGAAAT